MTSNEQPRNHRVVRLLWWLPRQIEHCLALAGLAFIVYFFCFQYSRIVSDSMKPTLQGTNLENGDHVLTERVTYRFRRPTRWEVATILRDDGVEVMKRVVGLPGEKLQILRGGTVVIDGEEVQPPPGLDFLDYIPVANVHNDQVVDCEDGYYVLGDYVLDSDDSRYNGTISDEEIVGRAWVILGPRERRGFINP